MSVALLNKVRGALANPRNAGLVEEEWHTVSLPSGRTSLFRTNYLDSCIRQAIARNGKPPTRRFYKYTKAKYADMMVNDGMIRVGSLVDYQNGEKHSGGVLDEAEGTQTVVVQAGDEIWTAENMPAPLKGILSISANQIAHVIGTTFNALAGSISMAIAKPSTTQWK